MVARHAHVALFDEAVAADVFLVQSLVVGSLAALRRRAQLALKLMTRLALEVLTRLALKASTCIALQVLTRLALEVLTRLAQVRVQPALLGLHHVRIFGGRFFGQVLKRMHL